MGILECPPTRIRLRRIKWERQIQAMGGARVCVPVAQPPTLCYGGQEGLRRSLFAEGGRIDRLDGDPLSLPIVSSSNIPLLFFDKY